MRVQQRNITVLYIVHIMKVAKLIARHVPVTNVSSLSALLWLKPWLQAQQWAEFKDKTEEISLLCPCTQSTVQFNLFNVQCTAAWKLHGTVSTCMYICTRTYVHMYAYIHVCTCTHMYTYVHICTHMYIIVVNCPGTSGTVLDFVLLSRMAHLSRNSNADPF